MPLAFESSSHGTIAFGFFNIESDMLLLDQYFFFAIDFCETVYKITKGQGATNSELPLQAYVIKDPADIGDLHGAIAGRHFSGFIGETYKKYPFPRDENGFKQQTEGYRTRADFEQMILSFGTPADLILHQDRNEEPVSIGPYVFTQQGFSQLIRYVIKGGYPGWLDDIPPDYVEKMQKLIVMS